MGKAEVVKSLCHGMSFACRNYVDSLKCKVKLLTLYQCFIQLPKIKISVEDK